MREFILGSFRRVVLHTGYTALCPTRWRRQVSISRLESTFCWSNKPELECSVLAWPHGHDRPCFCRFCTQCHQPPYLMIKNGKNARVYKLCFRHNDRLLRIHVSSKMVVNDVIMQSIFFLSLKTCSHITWILLLPQSATMIFPMRSTATPVGALNCPFPSPLEPNIVTSCPSCSNT